jgi:hypothetical protein
MNLSVGLGTRRASVPTNSQVAGEGGSFLEKGRPADPRLAILGKSRNW